MTTIDDVLKAEIVQIEKRMQSRALQLEADLNKIKATQVKKGAELQDAKLAAERALKFQLKIGTEYQCPTCGIEHKRRSSLEAGGTADSDFYRCRKCGRKYTVTLD